MTEEMLPHSGPAVARLRRSAAGNRWAHRRRRRRTRGRRAVHRRSPHPPGRASTPPGRCAAAGRCRWPPCRTCGRTSVEGSMSSTKLPYWRGAPAPSSLAMSQRVTSPTRSSPAARCAHRAAASGDCAKRAAMPTTAMPSSAGSSAGVFLAGTAGVPAGATGATGAVDGAPEACPWPSCAGAAPVSAADGAPRRRTAAAPSYRATRWSVSRSSELCSNSAVLGRSTARASFTAATSLR